MKKVHSIIALLVITCLALSTCLSAGAVNTSDQLQANNNYVNTYTNDLKTYVNNHRKTSPSTSVDNLVTDFIKANGSKYDGNKLLNSTNVVSIDIDNNNQIRIDKGIVYVKGYDTVAVTPDRIAMGAIDVSKATSATFSASASAASGTTPIVSYYYAAHTAILGQEVWRVTQEAQFTYTGSSVTVNYRNGYYTHGILSIWQVSNWVNSAVSSIFVNNVWTKKVMSSGNFHFGIEYQGIGLVIQDKYVTIDAECTVNGVTHGYYTLS